MPVVAILVQVSFFLTRPDTQPVQQKPRLRMASADEAPKHNTGKACWVIVVDDVYDVMKFLGRRMVHHGKDAMQEFDMFHSIQQDAIDLLLLCTIRTGILMKTNCLDAAAYLGGASSCGGGQQCGGFGL